MLFEVDVFILSFNMPRSKELTPILRAKLCELKDIGWSYRKIHSRYPDIPLSTIHYTIKKSPVRHQHITLP